MLLSIYMMCDIDACHAMPCRGVGLDGSGTLRMNTIVILSRFPQAHGALRRCASGEHLRRLLWSRRRLRRWCGPWRLRRWRRPRRRWRRPRRLRRGRRGPRRLRRRTRRRTRRLRRRTRRLRRRTRRLRRRPRRRRWRIRRLRRGRRGRRLRRRSRRLRRRTRRLRRRTPWLRVIPSEHLDRQPPVVNPPYFKGAYFILWQTTHSKYLEFRGFDPSIFSV